MLALSISRPHTQWSPVPSKSRVYLYNSTERDIVGVYADIFNRAPGENRIDQVDGLDDGIFPSEGMAFLGWIENRVQRLRVVRSDGRLAELEFDLTGSANDGVLFWRIQDADFAD